MCIFITKFTDPMVNNIGEADHPDTQVSPMGIFVITMTEKESDPMLDDDNVMTNHVNHSDTGSKADRPVVVKTMRISEYFSFKCFFLALIVMGLIGLFISPWVILIHMGQGSHMNHNIHVPVNQNQNITETWNHTL